MNNQKGQNTRGRPRGPLYLRLGLPAPKIKEEEVWTEIVLDPDHYRDQILMLIADEQSFCRMAHKGMFLSFEKGKPNA